MPVTTTAQTCTNGEGKRINTSQKFCRRTVATVRKTVNSSLSYKEHLASDLNVWGDGETTGDCQKWHIPERYPNVT